MKIIRGTLTSSSPISIIIVRILIFITLSLGTALLLRPLQSILYERMERTRDGIIAQAEDFLGRRITYSSMGPSLFGVLDIRDIYVFRMTEVLFFPFPD